MADQLVVKTRQQVVDTLKASICSALDEVADDLEPEHNSKNIIKLVTIEQSLQALAMAIHKGDI